MNKIWKGLKKKIQANSLIYKYYPIFRELPPQLRKKPSAYFLYKQLNDSLREGSHEEIPSSCITRTILTHVICTLKYCPYNKKNITPGKR